MTLSFCGETVRRQDPDRFLLSLFAPAARREAIFALFAFNAEIARTRSVVTDTQLGLIRLQWWREALARPLKGHPVLDVLHPVIKAYALPMDVFETLLYAREFDLEDRQPTNMAGLLSYADFTSTPLLQLSQKVLGVEEDQTCRDTAIGYALVGLLRTVPGHLAQRRCLLPAHLLSDLEPLYAGQDVSRLQPVVAEIAAEASRLLQASGARRQGKFVAVHRHLAHLYLRQLEKVKYDVFHPRLTVPPLARGLRLWWASVYA